MAAKELDCLYEACPVPLIKAVKELKNMNSGDILILHSDHSCVGISVEEWGEKNHYPVRVVEIEDGEWEIYIQKPE
ncbi:sulfurtransferase TusA family protein [Clostridium massiliodielmoense]|uniref:sulfurtransferase TusA family protein n=1 Tax=Clostridium massiliodielmoense TaxID=1776385 RepID=UPI0004D60932|nr:sulfurtransferase TusA family protein [Clostridium massiliodielmoense]KEH96716.1 response regulator SirA [Clostridium botulinum C/D str. BKT12695]